MSRWLQRYNAILRKEISDIIHRRLADQGVAFISITEVGLSKDAHHATVKFTVIGNENHRQAAQTKLDTASRFIKGELGRRYKNVTIPELRFIYDVAVDRGFDMTRRIDEIIRQDQADAAPH